MKFQLIISGILAICLGFFSFAVQALPSFARQTNQECSTCHIGSFGPQLTAYGIKFKIGGYLETNVSDAPLIPLSGMALAGFTATNSDITPPNSSYNANNNLALIQASAFLAGKLYDNIGSLIQGTYDGVSKKFLLDMVDIRYARETSLFDEDMTVGLSLNNNPTAQDPFNSSAAWRFPYATTSLANVPGTSPLIDGALAGTVFGLTGYTYLDRGIYAEFGGYMPSSPQYQYVTTGSAVTPSSPSYSLSGFAPYGRLAYMKDMKKSMFTAGFFALKGKLRTLNSTDQSDGFLDWGFDGNYQYLGTREHVFAVGGSYTHESVTWGQSWLNGGTVSNHTDTLHEINIHTSYYYDKTYGASIAFFDVLGKSDFLYYNNLYATNGNPNTNTPDSNGLIYQLDWTPFGKENSWGAYYANLRIGAQFTAYNKFNGNTTGASTNNTAFIFAWTAF